MKASFSIVIPIYNAEDTLEQTLVSVAGQRYQDFEVILLNDGSTDNSKAICEAWIKEHPEMAINLIQQENGGLGNARNNAIKKAAKPWVALLDADDLWDAKKLETVAKQISRKDADVLYHPVITFGLDTRRQRPCPEISSIEEILEKGNPIIPSAVVVKTEVLKKYPFSENPDFHGAEDFLLWLTLLKNDFSFYKINTALSLYREVDGMSTRLEEHLSKVNNVLLKAMENGWIDQMMYTKATQRKNLEAARFLHKREKYKEALAYYDKAGELNLKYGLLRFFCLLGF